MKSVVSLAVLPVAVAGFLLAGCATPTEREARQTLKAYKAGERLNQAFTACENAWYGYSDASDKQATIDNARLAALDVMNSSATIPNEARAEYGKTRAKEDRAFAAIKAALADWAAAIKRVNAAAEDYKKAVGGITDAFVDTSGRYVSSQDKLYRDNVAKYEQELQDWKEQRSLKP